MEKQRTELAVRQYSPLTLAFLGDSVYEVMVRYAMLGQGNATARSLHAEKIKLVCAGFQAKAAELILEDLTPEEHAVYMRGRNAAVSVPKNQSPTDYRKATGLESVFGYLSLLGEEERLQTLFARIWEARESLS